jgi:hypothetical protein
MLDHEFSQLEDYGSGAGAETFKCKEGKNKLRILAGGTPIAYHWFDNAGKKSKVVCFGMSKGCAHHKKAEDKPRIQHLFYVLNKTTEMPKYVIQLAELPYTVAKAIKAYSEEEGYEFASFPMPYDISVTYDPKESPANMYKVIASPNKVEVPQEYLDELAKKKPIADIVEERKAKAESEDDKTEEDIKPEDISF